MGKLQQIFSYTFNDNIWKLHAIDKADLMVIELRDAVNFQTRFSVYSFEHNKLLANNLTFEETWWVSVAHIHDNIIVFYTFDADQNPDQKSYFAYDIKSKKILWRDERFDFMKFKGGIAEVDRGGSKINISIVDAESTQIKSTNDTENKSLICPFHYEPENEHFKTVKQFMLNYFDVAIVGGVDYYEDDLVYISYNFQENGKLVNKLLVLDRERNIILHIQLKKAEKGISDNTFFLFNNKLIFVQEMKDFLIYETK